MYLHASKKANRLIQVRASAGAGKTYRIAMRYLDLLKESGRPSPEKLRAILAITFTNKASAEMKERIISFLKEISLGTPHGRMLSGETRLSPEEASSWLNVILLHYSDFHVRTIDSLLFSILKALSLEFNLPVDIKAVFDHTHIVEEVFDLILSEIDDGRIREMWEKALETYLVINERGGFYPERGLRRQIVELHGKLPGELKPAEDPVPRLQEIKGLIERRYEEFYRVYASVREYINGNLRRGIERPFDIDDWAKRRPSFIGKVPEELFTKKGSGLAGEKEFQEFSDAHSRFVREFARSLNQYLFLKAYARVGGYVMLLKKIDEEFKKLIGREGRIPIGVWTGMIKRKIFEEGIVPLVYSHFGSEFSHFLFDEFQDTNREQWDTLFPLLDNALSEGGTLFFVGDVKQAIYGWRGGDWRLFEEAASKFPQVSDSLESIPINGNYRSHPCIVAFNNTLFKPLQNEPFVAREIAPLAIGRGASEDMYQGLASTVKQNFSGHYQVPVNLNQRYKGGEGHTGREFPGVIHISQFKGLKEEVLDRVKETLVREVRYEWQRLKGKTSTPPVAVLVRGNDQAEEVASWLVSEGIPVVTENALKLRSSPLVKGLVSFLAYLYDPSDRIALYGFLASGLLSTVGSKEEEIVRGWVENNEREWSQSLSDMILRLRPHANRLAPYELLHALMEEVNLLERLDEEGLNSQRVFVERLLEVTHQFEMEEGPSLGRFLDFWKEGGLEARIGLPEAISAVQILTIHKAKGLEFPVVFIPFTDWILRSDPIGLYNGRLVSLKTPLPDELEKKRQEIRCTQAIEMLNLFYVATTRPMDRLYLYLTITGRTGNCFAVWIKRLITEAGISCLVQESG